MRRVLAALASVPLALAAGCGSACQDLGTRICECQPAGSARTACQRAIEDQIDKGNPKPGSGEQDFCEQKLRTCPDPDDDREMCDRLQTEEGKIACGLAYPEPAAP